MLLSLKEHHPGDDFTVMSPVVTELMPPFFENDFIVLDFFTCPEIRVGVVETVIRHGSREGYNIV